MSQTVKKISVTYNAINDRNTFTNGDIISGWVTVELAKDTKIDKLVIKLKGRAHVHWTEHTGKDRGMERYSATDNFLKLKQYFMTEDKSKDVILLKNEEGQPYSNVVAPGTHIYPFTFHFPPQILPVSFKVLLGNVSYFLEAKLSRSMKIPNQATAEFSYVPKADLTIPDLMRPQHGMTEKKMNLFTSGNVSFSVKTERMGHYIGEGIKVVLEVQNNSSRSLKPKYSLSEKHTFYARARREMRILSIQKEEGEPIPSSTKITLTKVITIPPSANLSILNCRVLKVEHHLKVYLDVPYATDPEIVVPVVILAASQAKDLPIPPQPNIGFEGYCPDQEGWTSIPYTAPPPAYEASGVYPPLPNYPVKS